MRLPHVSFIAAFFLHISAKSTYRIFFLHKLAFLTAILILFLFLLPIYIRFHYLSHLLANRMAPSMCPDPCGTRCGSWFQAISAAYSVFMRSAYLKKIPHKTSCLYRQQISVAGYILAVTLANACLCGDLQQAYSLFRLSCHVAVFLC